MATCKEIRKQRKAIKLRNAVRAGNVELLNRLACDTEALGRAPGADSLDRTTANALGRMFRALRRQIEREYEEMPE